MKEKKKQNSDFNLRIQKKNKILYIFIFLCKQEKVRIETFFLAT